MDTDVESEHKRQRKDRVQGRPAGTHLASPAPSAPSGPGRQGLSKWDPATEGLSSWASWAGEAEGEGLAGGGRKEAGGCRRGRITPSAQALPEETPHGTGHPGSVTLSHRDRTSCPSPEHLQLHRKQRLSPQCGFQLSLEGAGGRRGRPRVPRVLESPHSPNRCPPCQARGAC